MFLSLSFPSLLFSLKINKTFGKKKGRGIAGDSRNFFHRLNPHWFLQPEIVGTYLLGTGTLGWGPGVGLECLASEISLLNFYPPHVGVGPVYSASVSLLQTVRMWFL